jgi:hypothetical protein
MGEIGLSYVLSWATQTDAGANPSTFDLDYALAELTAAYGLFELGAGLEVLDGNGTKGFATPLATLHRFQGWADKFLTTPAAGIEDIYVNAVVDLSAIVGLDGLSIALAYHDYESEQSSADYGSEWNASIAARFSSVNFMLAYADYREGVLEAARDTSKFWIQIEHVL